MASVNFGSPENASAAPVIDIPATVTPDAPAPAAATEAAPSVSVPAVVTPAGAVIAAPAGIVLGDKLPDFKDIILPRLNIVQDIGELKNSFLPGTVVFNQAVTLFVPPDIDKSTGNVKRMASPPVNVTVLGFRPTRFVEKVAGGGRGMIVDTEDQVRAAGGTLDYKEFKLKEASGMLRFEPLADAVIVIERPETSADDNTVFVYEVEGKKYALGLWSLKGTSYTAAAKRVFFTARAVGCLRTTGYPSWHYALTTRLESYPGGNQAWVPVCLPKERSSDEFIKFVRSIIG